MPLQTAEQCDCLTSLQLHHQPLRHTLVETLA